MTRLFEPLRLRDLEVRNRIWVSPMCQYTLDRRDGVPRDWHLVHLGSFAIGGAGLILAEASAVTPDGRISPHDTGIWNDEQRDAWARIVDFVHSQGAAIGMQLAHAGRKASVYPEWGFGGARGTMPAAEGGWPTVSASAIAFDGYAAPRALSREEIAGLVQSFADAARRSVEAGFDLVEVHAAHGYLLHQFLSPLSNDRDDEYGGSLENRARFLLEVVRAVEAVTGPDVPMLVRFSATDYAEGGWDEAQTATVAQWAAEEGADLFDISSGGLVTGVHIPSGPGYQVPLAEYVRRESALPVNAVGLINTPQQAAEIVDSGRADAVMLGREMLRDPHFALRAATELGVELPYWPSQYLRARP